MNNKKISVLILIHYMICPPISGGVKRMMAPVLNMGESSGLEFSIMCVSYSPEELEHVNNYFSKLKAVKYFHSTLADGAFQFDREFTPPDFPDNVWCTMNKYYLNEVLSKVNKNQFDIIQITHPQLAWMVPKLRLATNAKIIMDYQNIEWLVFKRWIPYAKLEQRDEIEKQYMQLKEWEENVLDWFDDIFCISPVEKKVIEASVECARVHYVPTGAGVNDADYVPEDDNRDRLYDLVFVGSMSWFPTTDALKWLLTEIMPLIWDKRPQTKLEIIGSGSPDPELVPFMRSNKNITFWGALENEVPLLHQSKVFVSPLRIGAGVRLKNPTAWVAHLPVVATSLSAEGLEYTKDYDILIGDTPEEFAEHVIHLLEHKELRDMLTKNAYKSYLEHYSTDKLMNIWKRAYYAVVNEE